MNDAKVQLFDYLGYKPHEGQVKLHTLVDHYPVTTVVCGRRFGKTFSATYEAIYQGVQSGDNAGPPIVFLVSDTFAHSQKLFQPVAREFENNPFLKRLLNRVYRKDMVVRLKNGAEIWAKSADSPQSLAGDSVSFAIVDEAGYVSDEALEILRPALAARESPRRVSIGTPDRADTFFKREFDLGLGDSPNYASLQMHSIINPLVSEKYLAHEKAIYSEAYYNRMYLAEFNTLDGSPFAEVLEKVDYAHEEEPVAGRRYIAGVDLADRQDYTVVSIIDVTDAIFKMVRMERWKGIGYDATALRISELLKRYNTAFGYIDKTGVGDAAVNIIAKHYGNFQPVTMSLQSKQSMFDKLYTSVEKRELVLLNNEMVRNELRNVKAIQKTNGVSYSAPKGLNDDIFASLLLATNGFRRMVKLPPGVGSGFRYSL